MRDEEIRVSLTFGVSTKGESASAEDLVVQANDACRDAKKNGGDVP